jgi:hypothetical protein
MGKKDKNKGKKDEQKATNPLVILTLAEQKGCKNPREFPLYEEYHDSSYIKYHDKRQTVSLTEKGEKSQYYLHNDINKELVVYQIDGGIFSSTAKGDNKCDYGIYTEDELLILVELKGGDYKKAIKQLTNTTTLLGLNGSNKIKKLLARTVLTNGKSVPNITNTDIAKLKQLITKYNKGFKKEYIDKATLKFEDILSKIQ